MTKTKQYYHIIVLEEGMDKTECRETQNVPGFCMWIVKMRNTLATEVLLFLDGRYNRTGKSQS